MIIAMRADTLVLRQLDFMHDLLAAGAFLEQPLRNIAAAFPVTATANRRSLENSHVIRREPPSPRKRKLRRPLSGRGHIRSASSRWLRHRRSEARATLARPCFFVNERHPANFRCARRGRKRSGSWYNESAPGW